jgi:methylenetetrahydrofolate dehydrogenase (NADP+)/methenyltetrahydrofolate cyclohydrolase
LKCAFVVAGLPYIMAMCPGRSRRVTRSIYRLTAIIIDGAAMATEIRSEVAVGVAEENAERGVTPGLAVVLVGDDPASAVYVRNKGRAATEAGILARDVQLAAQTTQSELLDAVDTLNRDAQIHGLIVQLPLPDHIDEDAVVAAIDPRKDVDGLHPENVGRLVAGKPRFVSATPAGIQQLLLRSGYDPEGKRVVVCGRSNIVGKPLSILLMQRLQGSNATVTVCHTRTKNLGDITRQADILVAAIGSPQFITGDMVQEGVVVIDVGINRVDAPERKRGYRLVGDVDFDAVSEKAAAITPVPGGVGPMTIAMLLYNTLKAARSATDPG